MKKTDKNEFVISKLLKVVANEPHSLEKLDSAISNFNHEMPNNPVFHVLSMEKKIAFRNAEIMLKDNYKGRMIFLGLATIAIGFQALEQYLER